MDVLSVSECKNILNKIGSELKVSPKLISTRLLNDYDKSLLMSGLLEMSSLKLFVAVWRDMGMPDHAHGRHVPYNWEVNK